ncbi:MAG: hypothetical protein OXE94_02045, partial [Aestuariivita sp.]|nr:hypothetical protein [Aestuariivita sp.]
MTAFAVAFKAPLVPKSRELVALSPRVRGNPSALIGPCASNRSIPTRAGKPRIPARYPVRPSQSASYPDAVTIAINPHPASDPSEYADRSVPGSPKQRRRRAGDQQSAPDSTPNASAPQSVSKAPPSASTAVTTLLRLAFRLLVMTIPTITAVATAFSRDRRRTVVHFARDSSLRISACLQAMNLATFRVGQVVVAIWHQNLLDLTLQRFIPTPD